VAERRRNKTEILIDFKEEGEAFTQEELYAPCVMLPFAGHETTRNLIASGIYSLLRQPERTCGTIGRSSDQRWKSFCAVKVRFK
jgi:cytochrome P450